MSDRPNHNPQKNPQKKTSSQTVITIDPATLVVIISAGLLIPLVIMGFMFH